MNCLNKFKEFKTLSHEKVFLLNLLKSVVGRIMGEMTASLHPSPTRGREINMSTGSTVCSTAVHTSVQVIVHKRDICAYITNLYVRWTRKRWRPNKHRGGSYLFQ